MNDHVPDKALLAFCSEILSEKKADAIRSHIKSCALCSGKLAELKKVTSPFYAAHIAPSSHLKDRIITSYRKGKQGLSDSPEKIFQFPGLSVLKGAGWSLTVCLILIALYFFFPGARQDRVEFFIASHTGTVLINGSKSGKESVSAGDKISVSPHSEITIRYQSLTITLLENSHMTIRSTQKNNQIPEIDFLFTQGTLISRHTDKQVIVYSYETPHGSFTPVGTQFVLNANSTQSYILVTDGNVKISHKNETVTTKPSVKYIVSDSINERAITSEEARVFADLLERDKRIGPGKKTEDSFHLKKEVQGKKRPEETEQKDEKRELKKLKHEKKKDLRQLNKELRNMKKNSLRSGKNRF